MALANSNCYGPEIVWEILSLYSSQTDSVKSRIVNYISRAPFALIQKSTEFFGSKTSVLHEVLFLGYENDLEKLKACVESEDEMVRAYAMASIKRLVITLRRVTRLASRSKDKVIKSVAETIRLQ